MITELYVPRQDLPGFMDDVAGYLRERDADVVYDTVRLIEEDTDTFLPWARDELIAHASARTLSCQYWREAVSASCS